MINYETDFYGWTYEQARELKLGNFTNLDIENLIEEIEAMGRREKRELESRLSVLIAHLLKWQYQPVYRGNSWLMTIKEQRREVLDVLKENPSLKNRLDELLSNSYEKAIFKACKETGFDSKTFPETCPWQFNEITKNDFFPE